MSDSKSGSKNDLNESNMPLLDEEKAPAEGEKEAIEMKEENGDGEADLASDVWALVFALITVVHVWVVAPFLKIFDFKVAVVKRILTGLLACTVEPVCSALGSLFSKINVSQNRKIVQDA